MKKKTITVSLDDIEIDISLERIIEREVEKRLKEKKPEFTIYRSGRRQGNTFRALLKAQLLASGEPEQNVFFLTHSRDFSDFLIRRVADSLNSQHVYFEFNKAGKYILLENNSRIWFRSYNSKEFDRSTRGIRNIHYVYDND